MTSNENISAITKEPLNKILASIPYSQSISNVSSSQTAEIITIIQSISFYSPYYVMFSILMFTVFAACIEKSLIFFMWVFLITFVRILLYKITTSPNANKSELPQVCNTGLFNMFIPEDVTYTTYFLTFTLTYLVMPMILITVENKINIINYSIIALFVAYIIFDLLVKSSLSCIQGVFTVGVLSEIFSGLFLGALIVMFMMSQMRNKLFVNELTNNDEVCSRPTQQQFKCQVYKNGQLVG